jgi:carbamoyl-phosphate synthase small subunit
MKKAYLILSNGKVFEGEKFGYEEKSKSVGELVFTTGTCGYVETLTDPSYYGQIVLQTFPLIGNHGLNEEDFEGKCVVSGYVVREWCDVPSNFRSQQDLDTFLKQNKIVGICGVDTREITRIIREEGTMNAIISDTLIDDLSDVKSYKITDAVKNVSSKEKEIFKPNGDFKHKVALIDYGAKKNIIRELCNRGCEVTLFPNTVTAEEIIDFNPDGIMLSNGPGDPADNIFEISQLQKLVGKIPIFGICLGHQLLALANGAKTTKLKYGHRGVNQPVTDLSSKRTYITSQNHGYAVVSDTLKDKGALSFVNANDNTCEGIDYKDINAFSVQFHPEACSGPKDTSFLFNRFIDMMGGRK